MPSQGLLRIRHKMRSFRWDNMQGLLQLLFCFVLLAKGSSLQCETCESNNSSCTGAMMNCTEGDTCIIVISSSTLGKVPEYSIHKGCGSSAGCVSPHMHFDLGNGHMYHFNQFCCKEEDCSKIAPTLPPLEKDPKKKRCPACNSVGEACKKGSVECSGKDTACFTVIMKLNETSNGKKTDHIMKGCGSKNVCSVLQGGQEDVSEGSERITCTFSGASQALASFLTAFSSFWILQLLV